MVKKLTISDCQKIAQKKGGKCVSTHYLGVKSKLEWECSFGHRWLATLDNIKQGAWCHQCGGSKPLTIEEMQNIALERGGKCLSKVYANSSTKLEWECVNGHRWFSSPNNIRAGSWCHECGGSKKLSIKDMQKIASERNGKCLSKEYINIQTKLEWECSNGHRWFASPRSIKNKGYWCPECNFYHKEQMCRVTFEQIFEEKFIKTRPKWLRNSDGNLMELDGFCEKYRIGFEYQGEQHYFLNRFIDDEKKLEKRKKDDREKKELCAKHNVSLVIISYKDDLEKLPSTLNSKFKNQFPTINFNREIDFNQIYSHSSFISELHYLAAQWGGSLISSTYLDAHSKMEWECSKGHRWKASTYSVKNNGTWCPECRGTKKLNIEDMRELAASRGGKCLSTTYVNLDSKLELECERGHRWLSNARNVKHGNSWCKKCSGMEKNTIEQMKAIARERGGYCLSDEYVSGKDKLEWMCDKGHRWWALPNNVKNHNRWCKKCSAKKGWEKRKSG